MSLNEHKLYQDNLRLKEINDNQAGLLKMFVKKVKVLKVRVPTVTLPLGGKSRIQN